MSDIEESEISSSDSFNPEETKTIKKLLAEKDGWKKYGRIKVYCHQTIFIGPIRSWWWILFAFTIIVFVVAQFEYYPTHYYLMIASSVVFLVYFVSTVKTILADPGVWPRGSFDEAYANAIDLVTERHKSSEPLFSPTKIVDVKGETLRYSYCHRCHHFRPPRTGHCSTCDVCIENWDHHCPVFGGCVGKRNYQYFFTMAIANGAIHMLLLVSCMILAANRDRVEGFLGFIKSSMVVSSYVVALPMVCILPLILSFTPCERNKGGVNFLMDSPIDRDSTNSALNPGHTKFKTMASNNTTLDPFLKHLFPSSKKAKKTKPMTSETPLTIPQTPNANQNIEESQSIPKANENEFVEVELEEVKVQKNDSININETNKGLDKVNNIMNYGDILQL